MSATRTFLALVFLLYCSGNRQLIMLRDSSFERAVVGLCDGILGVVKNDTASEFFAAKLHCFTTYIGLLSAFRLASLGTLNGLVRGLPGNSCSDCVGGLSISALYCRAYLLSHY